MSPYDYRLNLEKTIDGDDPVEVLFGYIIQESLDGYLVDKVTNSGDVVTITEKSLSEARMSLNSLLKYRQSLKLQNKGVNVNISFGSSPSLDEVLEDDPYATFE